MQRPLATVVIGGVIGAMAMSLLVLRVLYLFFDAIAHAIQWFLIRYCHMSESVTAPMLGLLVEHEEGDSPLVGVSTSEHPEEKELTHV